MVCSKDEQTLPFNCGAGPSPQCNDANGVATVCAKDLRCQFTVGGNTYTASCLDVSGTITSAQCQTHGGLSGQMTSCTQLQCVTGVNLAGTETGVVCNFAG